VSSPVVGDRSSDPLAWLRRMGAWPGPASGYRSVSNPRHPTRADPLDGDRWLGGRRSCRGLCDVPGQLQAVRHPKAAVTRHPCGGRRARAGLQARGRDRLADGGKGTSVLRGEFPPGADRQTWRNARAADRLLRADRRRLAFPQSGVFRAALPAAARSGDRRTDAPGRQPAQSRQGLTSQCQQRDGALSRPRRHRRRRA
jgi:hypothetical protein